MIYRTVYQTIKADTPQALDKQVNELLWSQGEWQLYGSPYVTSNDFGTSFFYQALTKKMPV